MVSKKAQLLRFIIVLDIVGFSLIVVGAGLLRFSKDEITQILGGFVIAGGAVILGATRLIGK